MLQPNLTKSPSPGSQNPVFQFTIFLFFVVLAFQTNFAPNSRFTKSRLEKPESVYDSSSVRFGVIEKVTTPLTKERLEHADMDDALLSEEETKLHRSLTM